MKPFALLVKERMKDPERAVRETMSRLERWSMLSGTKEVKLDDVAWLGAIFALGGIEAGKAIPGSETVETTAADGSRVVKSVATDNGGTADYAGG